MRLVDNTIMHGTKFNLLFKNNMCFLHTLHAYYVLYNTMQHLCDLVEKCMQRLKKANPIIEIIAKFLCFHFPSRCITLTTCNLFLKCERTTTSSFKKMKC